MPLPLVTPISGVHGRDLIRRLSRDGKPTGLGDAFAHYGRIFKTLHSVVLCNSLYIDAAVKQLAADGFPVTDELLARLWLLQYEHINLLGRYAFTRPPAPGMRQLRDSDEEADDGEDE